MSSTSTAMRAGYFGDGSVVISPAIPGEGGIRRLAVTSGELVKHPKEGFKTIPDVVDYAVQKYGTKSAVAWRDVIKVHEEKKDVTTVVGGKEVTETKTWKYFELSEYKYLSFIEFQEVITEVARAFLILGITTDDVFNIYAQTSQNWQFISHGCLMISTPIATAYDTLGESGLVHSLNEPDCVGLFTNSELLQTVLKVLPQTPTVKFIIYDGQPSETVLNDIRAIRGNIKIMSLTELRALGRTQSVDIIHSRRPTTDTMACIMYTSGSTGPPKGVCITHSNIVASIGSVAIVFGNHIGMGDRYLAYLPLAHVLEFIVELIGLYVGSTSGYARPKTLTDASVRNCLGDLNAFKPTVMFGVPTVWESVRKGISLKLNSGGLVKQTMFNLAMEMKRSGMPILGSIAEKVVLSKVRAATGGNLRFAMNGGAAISKDTQEFLSLALMPMMQGYGMTESCGMCALLPPELQQYGVVGLPVPSVEIKFLDVPESGYLSSNNPPQGEVCIRGPSVTKGYYKRPDLNEDETIFTKDGWLRTGDIGQWNPDGTMSLIDRIKNLVKLQNGEYIALERLESIYKSCDYVMNLCVHASPEAKQPLAIIFPHEANLRYMLDSMEMSTEGVGLATLCQDSRVQDLILEECNALGRKNGFKSSELLAAVILTPDEWTPENGFVTPAQKIKRMTLAQAFSEQIKDVY